MTSFEETQNILKIVKDLENNLTDLQHKYKQLELKCEKMDEDIQNIHPVRKINETEENKILVSCDISYSEFIDSIQINNEHLQLYYDLTYDDAFIRTIERVVSFMDSSSIPFYSLNKKIMYYENDKWETWSKTDIENFVYKIHHKVMQQILVWQQENSVLLEYKDSTQQWFHGLLKKVTTRKSFSPDKVKKRLISIFNLKNIE